MAKKILFAVMLSVLIPALGFAGEWRPQYSLSLDLLGTGAMAPAGGPSFSGGAGAQFFADWRPINALSLGTGLDFTDYPGGSWQTSSWFLGGRLFPFGTEKDGEWYLQGTVGLNLVTQSLDNTWPGNFHGTVALDRRIFMGPGNALDLGAQYDLFTPISNPLQAVGVKVGWTLLFGNTSGAAVTNAAPPTPMPAATPVPAPAGKKKAKKKAAPEPTPAPTPKH